MDVQAKLTNSNQDFEATSTEANGELGIENDSLVAVKVDNVTADNNKNKKRPVTDWLLLWLCCMCNFLLVGYSYGIAVLFLDMKWTFGSSRSDTSLIQSMNNGLMFGGGIISSFVTSVMGIGDAFSVSALVASLAAIGGFVFEKLPLVILSVGVIGGLALCVMFTSLFIVIGRVFKDKYNMALSCLLLGGGIGSFVFPNVNAVLLENYGWRGTFLILVGVMLNTLPVGLLIRSLLSTNATTTGSIKKRCLDSPFFQSHISLWRDPLFVTSIVCLILRSVPIGLVTFFMLDIAEYKQFDLSTGSLFLSVVGFGNLSGRFLALLTRPIMKVSPVKEYALYIMFSGLAIFALAVADSYVFILAACVWFGLAYGMIASTAATTVFFIAGEEHYPSALGIFNTGMGIGFGIAGPIGGAIKDSVDSYTYVLFGFATVSSFSGILLMTVACCFEKSNLRYE
ncbi:monocarboxylate transporter 4 [Patella vulgata]|uniref:monocarboxylate transporter 4 n=1 Tax=Patella vulgata TaxID=6465 RepID=UPI00217FAB63|nr:monocarboxylate transporter 4 [Patella vulgata]